jgi:hypothetical protein
MKHRIGMGTSMLTLLGLLVAQTAHATTILLVTDNDSGAVMKRIQAELEASGFSVVTSAPSDGPVDRGALLDEARRRSAMAALRVKSAGAGVELWVVDRVTGKTVLRDVPRGEDDALLATKTTELLRASLLEVKSPGFQPSEVPPPERLASFVPVLPAPPAPPRGYASGTVSALHLGDGGTFGLVGMGMHVPLGDHFQSGLRLALSVTRSELSEPEGTSSQSFAHALVDFDYLPRGVSATWSPMLGASLGGSIFRTSGSAAAPYTSETDSVMSVVGAAHGGLRLRLSSAVTLQADCAALAMLPRPNVRYAGRSVAKVGIPAAEASLRLFLAAW